MPRSAAALVTDLIFATKTASTAQSAGVSVHVVRTLDVLRGRLAEPDVALVLIDLNADGVDVLEAVRLARSAAHRPRVLAYLSHVQTALATAAAQAGADEVMPRSAFSARLPALLASVNKQAAGDPPTA